MAYNYRPVILIILDGWGISPEYDGNAIMQAQTPILNNFKQNYPYTALQAASIAVGLSWGEMGNSEVGHTIIGAGKIIYQNLSRITLSIQNRALFDNQTLLGAMAHAHKNNSNLHLVGLASAGGVHSHIDHLFALLEIAREKKISRVFLHLFTDGRDTPPNTGYKYIKQVQNKIKESGIGAIASIIGRYWAMDRNNNWPKTKKAYEALVFGIGRRETDALAAIDNSYKKEITDEFMEPIVIADKNTSNPLAAIQDNDSVIFFNFREDRARQLTEAFISDDFDGFPRSRKLQNLYFATMTEYKSGLPAKVIFPPEKIIAPLGKILSEKGVFQLHIAETEKYAHVTYFFNGGIEKPFEGEKDVLIPSPSVSRFDETPEMSAHAITDRAIEEMATLKYDFVLINFANADMVGHTGNMKAIISAIETVDKCVGKIAEAAKKLNAAIVITADHGNAEQKINFQSGEILTEHTSNPVPLWLVAKGFECASPETNNAKILNVESVNIQGLLSDIAPTILDLMNIKKPAEMSGQSLLPILSEQTK